MWSEQLELAIPVWNAVVTIIVSSSTSSGSGGSSSGSSLIEIEEWCYRKSVI